MKWYWDIPLAIVTVLCCTLIVMGISGFHPAWSTVAFLVVVGGVFLVWVLGMLGFSPPSSPCGLRQGIPYSQGIYFPLITSSTVGFGDITPKTGIGQCISVFLAFVGTIYFGLMVTVATRAFTETIKESLHAQGKPESNG
ncbi:Ion channel [Symmachiella macrocystis]|uniref:Ion channel n=1 Tax=Symmachiella macrocystis TaxID=2527985 RepID=A0A5C6AYJ9_9PLAN|nr:potassium channel family protein [Symmachiella macrocystis]TWU05125.1 Ion channel [Symmachiella macrocystis]